MPDLKTTIFLLVSSLLLAGCVSQRYVGVQISSTNPVSFTRVLVNGNTVVICDVRE
ncbi:hypothetical protein [Enterobacter ludwigii]|uniref:hypothetical protein n=1 Tax=Enterobacter ludwigii TaxID=299767 RepID=UPI0030766DE7